MPSSPLSSPDTIELPAIWASSSLSSHFMSQCGGGTCSSPCSGYDTLLRVTLPHGDSPYPTQLSPSHQAVPLHKCPHPSWARPPGARLSLCVHTRPLPLRLQPLFSHHGFPPPPYAHIHTLRAQVHLMTFAQIVWEGERKGKQRRQRDHD